MALLEDELVTLETRKVNQVNQDEDIQKLAQAMREGAQGQMREKFRYTLSRSVDRIVLAATPTHRTARLEVGPETRFIDWDRKEKTIG